MLSDTVVPQICLGVGLFLAGALVSQGVTPFGSAVRRAMDLFLRVTRIKPDAGREAASEDEILALVDRSEEKGSIEQNEKELIENVFEFNNSTAEDLMVHRTDMVLLWSDSTEEEILSTIRETGLSRFPLCQEDADDVIGILSTRDYLLNLNSENPKPLKELVRPAYFVPESVRADLLFRDMQSRKVHMAIVVDEYGGTAGIVTMEDLLEDIVHMAIVVDEYGGTSGLITLEDLLEEIVGNIYDEFDPQEESEIIHLEDNLWRVSGSADLEALGEALGMELPENEEYDTLGGLVFAQLAVIPEDGTQLEVQALGLKIQVEELTDRRVEWALVSKVPPGRVGLGLQSGPAGRGRYRFRAGVTLEVKNNSASKQDK